MGSFRNFFQHLSAKLTFLIHRGTLKRMVLRKSIFESKRVIIIGPARTVQDDLLEFDLTSFDYVVKMNNGIDVPLQDAVDGSTWRCDVLFHSFSPDVVEIDREKAEKAGIQFLVYRTPARRYLLDALKTQRRLSRNGIPGELKVIEQAAYGQLKASLAGSSPTTGLVCIDFFLSCKTSLLAVVGFTFFQTAYVSGYDDRVQSDDIALRRVLDGGHHDPERERMLVRELLAAAAGCGHRVSLGKNVRATLGLAEESQL